MRALGRQHSLLIFCEPTIGRSFGINSIALMPILLYFSVI